MTDGTLWFIPPATNGAADPVDSAKLETKGFHAHDGTAMSLARLGGLKTGLITRRTSETVARRARDLRLDYAFQGVVVKIRALQEILDKEKISAAEMAYVGDDVIDLPIMRRCGLAVAVANARDEVKEEAHWTTPHRGGEGAIRDVVEYILKAQGTWDSALKSYLERGDAPKYQSAVSNQHSAKRQLQN
jgi:3-deoxy-D-manno-octulosonate 8-phosphate phosphatase (KDO 8-P phosphatase)